MKTFLTALALTFSMSIFAQLEAPQPSPNSNTTQMVGLSELSIAYSRPSAKGRAVFGNLVPYNKRWRTGANENTIITFSTDVKIGEQALEAGSYAVYSTPKEESWDVFFYVRHRELGIAKKHGMKMQLPLW